MLAGMTYSMAQRPTCPPPALRARTPSQNAPAKTHQPERQGASAKECRRHPKPSQHTVRNHVPKSHSPGPRLTPVHRPVHPQLGGCRCCCCINTLLRLPMLLDEETLVRSVKYDICQALFRTVVAEPFWPAVSTPRASTLRQPEANRT